MIHDWLFCWGPPTGGLIFSGFDGLASVVQAAMALENYNVIAFEKDQRVWAAATSEIVKFGATLDKRAGKLKRAIEHSTEMMRLVTKSIRNPDDITQDEVRSFLDNECL